MQYENQARTQLLQQFLLFFRLYCVDQRKWKSNVILLPNPNWTRTFWVLLYAVENIDFDRSMRDIFLLIFDVPFPIDFKKFSHLRSSLGKLKYMALVLVVYIVQQDPRKKLNNKSILLFTTLDLLQSFDYWLILIGFVR